MQFEAITSLPITVTWEKMPMLSTACCRYDSCHFDGWSSSAEDQRHNVCQPLQLGCSVLTRGWWHLPKGLLKRLWKKQPCSSHSRKKTGGWRSVMYAVNEHLGCRAAQVLESGLIFAVSENFKLTLGFTVVSFRAWPDCNYADGNRVRFLAGAVKICFVEQLSQLKSFYYICKPNN